MAIYVGARDLSGLVVGTHQFIVITYEKGDLTAAMEFFGGIETKWHTSDYDTQLIKVQYGSVPEQETKIRVINLIENYILNQATDPIRYPTAGFGVNSNSWTQSVIEYSCGKVSGDMKGLDISNSKRVPRTYFMPFCTAKPRIKVN